MAPTSLVGRIMRTLELLAASPLTAAQLGRRLEINRSTALRLLSELIDTGAVSRDPETKRYSTVPSWFLKLAVRPSPHPDWTRTVDPTLVKVRNETGDSVILGVPVEQTMVYLGYHPTGHVLGVSERVGTVRPMHCSALGKAYLSGLPSDELQAQLDRLGFEGGTDRAARNAAELHERVLEARKDGYAIDLEETFDAVRCVAVPLRMQGALVGAVGVSAPATRLPVTRMRELGTYLRKELGRL